MLFRIYNKVFIDSLKNISRGEGDANRIPSSPYSTNIAVKPVSKNTAQPTNYLTLYIFFIDVRDAFKVFSFDTLITGSNQHVYKEKRPLITECFIWLLAYFLGGYKRKKSMHKWLLYLSTNTNVQNRKTNLA